MVAWQGEIRIRHCLEHAFRFLADARNEPLWDADLEYCHQDEGSEPGEGASYRYERITSVGTVEGRKTCIRFEPPQMLEWRVDEGRHATTVRVELDKHGEGLVLRHAVRSQARGLTRWYLKLRRTRMAEALGRDLQELKALLEGQEPSMAPNG